jgi:hypothetical protein
MTALTYALDCSYATNDTESSCVCDSRSEFRACCDVHSSQQYWVFDLQEVGDRGLDLLWRSHYDGLMLVR